MTDIYSTIFRPLNRARDAPSARRRRPDPDLSRDPPRNFQPPPETPVPGTLEQTQRRISRQRRPNQTSDRSLYLAQGVIEAERAQARQPGQLPHLEERSIAGADYVTGQVRYSTRRRSVGEIVTDVAQMTGVPLEFLDNLISHESGGRGDARAPTTSATGYAQFTDDTWLAMISQYAPRYGDEGRNLAALITRTPSGGYKTETQEDRRRLLALRSDPRWAAVMTAHYSQENAAALRGRLGRDVREGEVYLAHFLGPRDAANLLAAAGRSTAGRGHGEEPAASFVDRDSVESNPQIFYEGGRYEWRTHPRTGRRYQHYAGGGRPRTVREVIELQTRRFRQNVFPQAGGENGGQQGQAGLEQAAGAGR